MPPLVLVKGVPEKIFTEEKKMAEKTAKKSKKKVEKKIKTQPLRKLTREERMAYLTGGKSK